MIELETATATFSLVEIVPIESAPRECIFSKSFTPSRAEIEIEPSV